MDALIPFFNASFGAFSLAIIVWLPYLPLMKHLLKQQNDIVSHNLNDILTNHCPTFSSHTFLKIFVPKNIKVVTDPDFVCMAMIHKYGSFSFLLATLFIFITVLLLTFIHKLGLSPAEILYAGTILSILSIIMNLVVITFCLISLINFDVVEILKTVAQIERIRELLRGAPHEETQA